MINKVIHEWNKGIWNELASLAERLPHALLIHGLVGVGKRALAEHLAQFLLCEGPGSGRPCGRCDGCRWFVAGNHPDVRWLEPEAIAKAAATAAEEEDRATTRPAKPSLESKGDQDRALAGFLNCGSHRRRERTARGHPAAGRKLHAPTSPVQNLEEPPPVAGLRI